MSERRGLSRATFLSGALAACAATVGVPEPARPSGARSGSWCRELTKVAREQLYDFSLEMLDGKDDFALSAFAGRPVWLNFFTTWCGPCNREAPDIVRIAKSYGETLAVVGIDVEEPPAKVRAFRDRHKIPFPIALDRTGSVFDQLGFTGYPTHMFFDARGLVSCISVGSLTPNQMENEVAVAAARTPLRQLGTPEIAPPAVPAEQHGRHGETSPRVT